MRGIKIEGPTKFMFEWITSIHFTSINEKYATESTLKTDADTISMSFWLPPPGQRDSNAGL